MKRQSSISSFFTKKAIDKKPKLQHEEEISTAATATSSSIDVDSPISPPPAPRKSATKPTLSKSSLPNQELQKLHDKFSQKFGSIDRERFLKRQRVEQLMTDISEQKDEVIPHQKFTPLETQVVELKAKYPGCLLLVEVGYKFRFFGEDAKVLKA